MAFYKDISDRRNRTDKQHDAEQRGGFDDEGSHYRDSAPRGDRPPQGGRPAYGAPRGDRPPQGGRPAYGAPRGDRPPQGGRPAYGAPRGDRPPQGGRPSYGAPRGDRPPQGGRPSFGAPRGDRPPRGDHFDNGAPRGDRPPQGGRPGFGAPRGDRPPRTDRVDNGAPRGDRPPRGDHFDNGAPRGDRPPQGGRPGFGAPRGDRPPRGDRFDNGAPRGDRPPQSGRPGFGAPRGDRAPYRGRSPRVEGDYRFAPGGQQPYRSRGAESAPPRPYDELRRERRDTVAPRDYESYRYEAPARPPRPVYDAPELEAEETVPAENLLCGRNPIREALKSGRDIEKLLVARGELSGSAREIVAIAHEQRVPVQEVDRARLDALAQNHQGMVAFASAYQYHTVEEMLALAAERGEAPFLVVLDGVTDPHNLGAIIRTAECAGAHGVIVQERRAVGLTPAAVKASAGAIEHLFVARVVNLVATLQELKRKNIWIYAADMTGEDYAGVDFTGGVALVIGSEGEGVSRLVLDTCDKRVSLPVRGKLDSLNASVAAGILLYAVLRAR